MSGAVADVAASVYDASNGSDGVVKAYLAASALSYLITGQVRPPLPLLQRVRLRVRMVRANRLMLLKTFWWTRAPSLNRLNGGSLSIPVLLTPRILRLVNPLSKVLSIVWVRLLHPLNMLCPPIPPVCLCWASGPRLKVIRVIRLNILSLVLPGMVRRKILSGMLRLVSLLSIVRPCLVSPYWWRKLAKSLNLVRSVPPTLLPSRMWQLLATSPLLVLRHRECLIVTCIPMLLTMHPIWFLLLLLAATLGGAILLLGRFGLGDRGLGLFALGGILGGIIGLLLPGLHTIMGLLLKLGLVNRCAVFPKLTTAKHSPRQLLCRCAL